jgi:hypothetical protein
MGCSGVTLCEITVDILVENIPMNNGIELSCFDLCLSEENEQSNADKFSKTNSMTLQLRKLILISPWLLNIQPVVLSFKLRLNPAKFKMIAACNIFNANRSYQVGVCVRCVHTNGLFEVAGQILFAHMVYIESKCTGLCKKFIRQKI